MSMFTKAENTSAFLKMGLLGFQGSGKTKDRDQGHHRTCAAHEEARHPLCR
jgi:hypothetical protein